MYLCPKVPPKEHPGQSMHMHVLYRYTVPFDAMWYATLRVQVPQILGISIPKSIESAVLWTETLLVGGSWAPWALSPAKSPLYIRELQTNPYTP